MRNAENVCKTEIREIMSEARQYTLELCATATKVPIPDGDVKGYRPVADSNVGGHNRIAHGDAQRR